MTSRERRRPQSAGVFERRGNEVHLKPEYENLNVRIKNTLRSINKLYFINGSNFYDDDKNFKNP